MKKIFLGILCFLLIGCVSSKNINEKSLEVEKKDKIQLIMDGLSVEEKIAQMLVIEYDSPYLDENLSNMLTKNAPGGFILMKPNITTFDDTRKLVSDLKENSKIPLMISIDQEGGSVQRLKYLSDAKPTDIPFMYDVGLTGDTELAYEVGKVIAEEVRTLGVNVVFAPVIDIFSNENNTVIGKRSFGSDSDVVSSMAISLADGLEDNGVIATFKHFPGHGDTDVDSHLSLPVIRKSYDDLNSLELVPFRKATENGAKLIMVAHIAFPNITGDNTPSSLSSKVISILKDDLNYKGLVITDALNMGALTEEYSDEEIYTKAIEAGADLLLMPNDGIDSIEYIKDNISEDRINQSVRKILKFKYDNLKDDNFLDKSYLGSDEHQEVINRILKEQ